MLSTRLMNRIAKECNLVSNYCVPPFESVVITDPSTYCESRSLRVCRDITLAFDLNRKKNSHNDDPNDGFFRKVIYIIQVIKLRLNSFIVSTGYLSKHQSAHLVRAMLGIWQELCFRR